MLFFEMFVLAIALAIDAMLVSFSYGLIININRFKTSFIMAFLFAFFQAFMPLLGWLLSGFVYSKLELYSKYIVFLIFFILGVKFLKDVFYKKENNAINCISIACIFYLSLATSVDAFAAGISVKFSGMPIFGCSIIIGIVTFVLSFFGFWITELFKKFPSKVFELIGGLLLIGLGIKSLV